MSEVDSCSELSGRVAPVVNRNRCEGKDACVVVCPFDVFEIAKISKEERAKLSIIGKIKAFNHGGMQAFVINPSACHACKLCIDACPENALSLQPYTP
tara:strand:+ start:1252 stop:1545 length:294 start_codon:yes stop_codon:yes gene_type:complete